ncbi:hypothetical protein LSTR_LSTR014511, partial [Laodelphax striatellus]
EKEEEFENTRKNHQRALDSMQASLEAEAKGKAEALRMKKKLEADINELEIALDHANKANAEAQKNIKRTEQQLKDVQTALGGAARRTTRANSWAHQRATRQRAAERAGGVATLLSRPTAAAAGGAGAERLSRNSQRVVRTGHQRTKPPRGSWRASCRRCSLRHHHSTLRSPLLPTPRHTTNSLIAPRTYASPPSAALTTPIPPPRPRGIHAPRALFISRLTHHPLLRSALHRPLNSLLNPSTFTTLSPLLTLVAAQLFFTHTSRSTSRSPPVNPLARLLLTLDTPPSIYHFDLPDSLPSYALTPTSRSTPLLSLRLGPTSFPSRTLHASPLLTTPHDREQRGMAAADSATPRAHAVLSHHSHLSPPTTAHLPPLTHHLSTLLSPPPSPTPPPPSPHPHPLPPAHPPPPPPPPPSPPLTRFSPLAARRSHHAPPSHASHSPPTRNSTHPPPPPTAALFSHQRITQLLPTHTHHSSQPSALHTLTLPHTPKQPCITTPSSTPPQT